MGPFVRIVSSAAIAGLTLGSASVVTLAATASVAQAKSSNSNDGNSGGGSRGQSGDRSHGQNGKGYGRGGKNGGGGAAPGICGNGLDNASGIDVYNFAVTAVAGAQDALQRAAARLDESQIPGAQATTADADALIASVKAKGFSLSNMAALTVLQRQRDYLQAREDLSAREQARTQARNYAAKGIAMSAAAKATLESDC